MERKTVLVVDDDSGIGEMLQTLLELNGFRAIVTDKPDKTEALMEAHSVDLVLLDKLISGVNGTEVCARLKSNGSTARTPVLMMSALHEAGENCKRAGADDFIAKPFDMDGLLEKIDQLIHRQ